MKKYSSKGLVLLLALIMVVSLAACKKEDKNANKETATTEQNQSNTGSGEESKGDSTEAKKTLADYPKVSGFNYFVGFASGLETEELNNCGSAQLVKEYTGYDVVYDQAPADANAAETAITNIFMLKSDYQAVKVSKNQFYTLLQMGALKDITEYVEASTNLKEQISEFGWETATMDGAIYGIPTKNARKVNNTAIAFRLDWLNEYNETHPDAQIPVPSEENGYSMSLSDFKTMLTYFATKVPKGGKAMAVDMGGVYLENILPAFGIYQEWADVDGKLEYVINQPGFQEYMDYMEDLFDSGLIMYQATSNDAGAVKSLQAKTVGAGRVAHWNAVTIESSDTQEVDPNISYIVSLVPDDRKGDPTAVRTFATEGYSYYTVIPNYATDEQAAAVIDWIDKKLDKDFFLKLTLGTEGETFTIENGGYYPILPTFDEKQGVADKFVDGTREEEYAEYWLCRTRKTKAQDKMFSIANYNIDQTAVLNPTSVMPPNADFDTYYTNANIQIKDLLVTSMFQTGVTKSLDEIKAEWKNLNGDVITDAVNAWYSTWEGKDTFNTVK